MKKIKIINKIDQYVIYHFINMQVKIQLLQIVTINFVIFVITSKYARVLHRVNIKQTWMLKIACVLITHVHKNIEFGSIHIRKKCN